MTTIVVDAFGGDYAPGEIVAGCVKALKARSDVQLILCGKQSEIRRVLSEAGADMERIEIRDASEVIENHEEPVKAVRSKKDSSLVVAMQALRNKEAQIFLSSGSTGAVLAAATLIAGRISGIKRPALAPLLPTVKDHGVLLVDCGANVDCKSAYLQQFALMGSIYMRQVMGVDNPRVGLLNNGAEAEKGNELTKSVYPLLERMPINFVGNCEARNAMSGDFDVIVADGFAGNVLLKSIEGTAVGIMKMLKDELMSNTRSKLGAAMVKPALLRLREKMNYEAVGGALLLGIDGGVIKTHGNAKAAAIISAVNQGCAFAQGRVIERIRESIESIGNE